MTSPVASVLAVPRGRAFAVVLAAGAVAGVVLRVLVHRSSLGVLDGDEAVWGLMVRYLLDGEVAAFFWGQGYGGTQEVFLTAPLFAVFGTSTLAMRLVPLVLTAVAALLVWRIGRRTIGEPAASVAAVLLWIWPPYLIWKSDRAHGFYGSGLVLVCLVVLLVVRLGERRSRVDAALLGLVLGLGWWQTPQIVPIALPALLWLLWRQPAVIRDIWVAVPLVVVGVLPWLISNLEHDWWSFDISSGQTPYPTRLRGFFSATFPMGFGLREPFTSEWLLGTVMSGVVYLALIVLFAWAWWRRRSSPTTHLLFGIVAAFPFVYALSPSTWLVDEPRYVTVLLPVLALLIAQALTTLPRAAVAVAGGVALSAFVLWHLSSAPAFIARADGLFVPRDFGPVIAELERNGPRHVFASYWPAYRIDYETRERIIAAESRLPSTVLRGDRVVPKTPTRSDESRHPEYFTVVRRDPDAGFVLLRTARELGRKRTVALLERAGYQATVVDGFVIYRPPPR
jgi:hypothetical protein